MVNCEPFRAAVGFTGPTPYYFVYCPGFSGRPYKYGSIAGLVGPGVGFQSLYYLCDGGGR